MELLSPAKLHVKKGDLVLVITGKDAARQHRGRILRAEPKRRRVWVEGANVVKRHQKPRGNRPGGIIEKPGPIDASNIMLVCPSCNQPTRPRQTRNAEGRLARICRRCDKPVDQE